MCFVFEMFNYGVSVNDTVTVQGPVRVYVRFQYVHSEWVILVVWLMI